ncbi:hypothetical protein [Maritimibacter sp. UBA3975]|uniref:hypothetical protein n=1 Tax=Maritimibacter sp. UBA3975 TaxID=1946833 RepID=UPI000C0B49AF|nr:hypothetical protein [Maritimibacter sp. UBA3975]MAM62802.1 hypothetical protein [Maritimibacter sp.]|tara:strand:+ start:8899 stop:9237 length:339 start_codon:yes stop_codon:yes gene_type:complete
MHRITSIIMALALVLSGVVLAGAKGVPMPVGTDIVICSGVGVTTITIGPDGEPVENVDVCPEGHSIFAAAFSAPPLPAPELRRVALPAPSARAIPASREEVTPAARGPPLTI